MKIYIYLHFKRKIAKIGTSLLEIWNRAPKEISAKKEIFLTFLITIQICSNYIFEINFISSKFRNTKKGWKNNFLKKSLIFTLAKFASGALFDISDDEAQFSFVLTKIKSVKILFKNSCRLESKGPKASMFSRMIL